MRRREDKEDIPAYLVGVTAAVALAAANAASGPHSRALAASAASGSRVRSSTTTPLPGKSR